MAAYKLFIEKAVLKQLKSIPESDLPEKQQQLKGRPGYRIREGNYRVIYEINDKILTFTVIEAGNRKRYTNDILGFEPVAAG